jgi:hypothetical protein
MVISVRANSVVNPQRLAILGIREGGDTQVDNDRRLMIVYTGWIAVTHSAVSALTRNRALSFVPNSFVGNGKVELQTFKERGPDDPPEAEAIITASLSSFGTSPDVAAVDEAEVSIEKMSHLPGDPRVLVLRATLAVEEGSVNGISYQVTVLVHPKMIDTVEIDVAETP